jgi:hypothetical protein
MKISRRLRQMRLIPILIAVTALMNCAFAHMHMTDPPALRSKDNPFSTPDTIDYSINNPLGDASQWPCKGYTSLLGTSQAQPVKTWTAGNSYSFTITGNAPHGGGSCQASISTDGGKSFKVIHSYIGKCPGLDPESSFDFRLPADTPQSDNTLFMWTWYNTIGNREVYADCAVIKINGGSGSESTSFSSRPDPFKANIGNGCSTIESKSLLFPNPGPDVSNNDALAVPPVGEGCGAASSESGSIPLSPTPSSTSANGGGYQGPAGNYPPSATTIGTPGSETCNCVPGSQPNAVGYPGGTFKPGNDWPAGFNSGCSRCPNSGAGVFFGIWVVVLGMVWIWDGQHGS